MTMRRLDAVVEEAFGDEIRRRTADAIDDLDGPTPCAAFSRAMGGKPSLGLCHHGGPDGTDSYTHRITGHGLTGEGPTLPDALRDWIVKARDNTGGS